MELIQNPGHPGVFIKDKIIPKDMNVKNAAALLGVGRPALSNLLNGKASLSPEMALRFERAFKIDQNVLLQLQATFDLHKTEKRSSHIEVRNYVPAFHAIKSVEIENWSGEKLEARSLMAVVIRKLVHSTASGLEEIDFPGYDDAENKGWDGKTIATAATPWVPQGLTCWEFGCHGDPKKKADEDYNARIKSIPISERKNITLVFVTPKRWPGKQAWLDSKKSAATFRSLKAYDASDLEQWLEQSIPAQTWLAQQMGSPESGAQPLEAYWEKWAGVTVPELKKEIFTTYIDQNKTLLSDWLNRSPSDPLIIAADSKEEALAFLFAAFSCGAFPTEQYLDNTIVFSSTETFKKISKGSAFFVSVVFSEDVEHELGSHFKQKHTVIIRPKNDTQSKVDIVIDSLNHDGFEKALSALGLRNNEMAVLARESGRSLTVLRRHLSKIPGIKNPKWSQHADTAIELIPFMFAGVWNTQSDADTEILALLSGRSKEELEKQMAALLQIDDSPIWSIGKTRGVISKIDILYAVHSFITKKDIDNFLFAASFVLSEKDPSLDLPEDKRWAAPLYGKIRNHSAMLRNSICETIVILAVHGNDLMKSRFTPSLEYRINQLIAGLLTPLSYEILASNSRQLSSYAESAPDTFLNIIEEDLKTENPQVFSVMTPMTGIFGTSSRSGLLWALECLAWDPLRMLRVAGILAKMTEKKILDNLVNKPQASLEAIFRGWMPQTAASLEQRKKGLIILARKYPAAIWQLCMRQLNNSDVAHASNRPVWRREFLDFGQLASKAEHREFLLKVVELVIEWPHHTGQTLGDLIERFPMLSEDVQEKLYAIILTWAESATDEEKATLKEKIRLCILIRKKKKGMDEKARLRAKKMFDALHFEDVVMKHSWLFITPWVDFARDEIEEVALDFQQREEKIATLRTEALKEIFVAKGIDGIMQLLSLGESSVQIGWLLSKSVIRSERVRDFLSGLLQWPDPSLTAKTDEVLRGFLAQQSTGVNNLHDSVIADWPAEQALRLLKMAPLGKQTWEYVNQCGPELRIKYWNEVRSESSNYELSESNELIDRFIEAGRPRAAFHAVRLMLEKIETERLLRLLHEMAGSTNDEVYQFPAYNITKAFTTLNARPNIKEAELASLEFKYINALEDEYPIPNLQKQVARSPALYMQILASLYKRKDKQSDENELAFVNGLASPTLASSCYSVLAQLKRLPGTGEDGKIVVTELMEWINEVRKLCSRHDRIAIGDQCIGQLLARGPVGEDGIWPAEPVREVLEEIVNKDIASGLDMGVFNSQGVFRGVGGKEEHKLALKYEQWAKQLSFEYPSVSKAVEGIARGYYHEANQEGTDATLRTRLGK